MSIRIFIFLFTTLLLSSCSVGPNYEKPCIDIPEKYKEAPPGWKMASPCDEQDRGAWWKVFNDAQLNALEERVNISNQNIKVAIAQYRQALALVDQARAAYFPTLMGSGSVTRQKTSSSRNISSTSVGVIPSGSQSNPFTEYLVSLNAAWEPDLWGSVRRAVESSRANAQASAAQLALMRLSMQGSLAQTYFEWRAAYTTQKLLEDTVIAYKKFLQLTKNRYKAGVAARLDVIQAETQLQTAEAEVLDNQIPLAQYEHAIAVLVGEPPACFALSRVSLAMKPPIIPLQVPSMLLERRPDVASAERQVAAANARIGVAIAAYFPSLNLSATGGYDSTHLNKLFTKPAQFWSLGAQLAETLFDGGLRKANVKVAYAQYDQMVATYRQTVLAAFQDVEDNLVALHQLKAEVLVQNAAVKNAELALKILVNRYKSGIAAYMDVITAQNTLYTAQQTAINIVGREMVSAVGLIKSLGGGWGKCNLKNSAECPRNCIYAY